MDLTFLANPFMIPIVAILCGTLLAVLKHREKMAMIERGLLPSDEEEGGDKKRGRRLEEGGPSGVGARAVAASAEGYHDPGQNQPGPGQLNRR